MSIKRKGYQSPARGVGVAASPSEKSTASSSLEAKRLPNLRLVRNELARELKESIIGQDEAINKIVKWLIRSFTPLRDPERPILSSLLLGPTGVGKTETARIIAKLFFGRMDAMVRVDCGEYTHGHEVAKILGSPPGYVGGQIEPLFSESNLQRPRWLLLKEIGRGGSWPSQSSEEIINYAGSGLKGIILIDEVEKAHWELWQALLGVLDYGRLTLGDNKEIDMRASIIIMTSNVGSAEIDRTLSAGIGFAPSDGGGNLESVVLSSVARVFPPELRGRVDVTAVYRPLGRPELERILEKIISDMMVRSLRGGLPIVILVRGEVKKHLIDLFLSGPERTMGARGLNRVVSQTIGEGISDLIIEKRIIEGSRVEIHLSKGKEVEFVVS